MEGNYNETAFELLDTFLGWVEERELVAHGMCFLYRFPFFPCSSFYVYITYCLLCLVSPFVGWMSGGYFWPSWKGNMALFADPIMINRSIAYATKVASVAASIYIIFIACVYAN